MPQKAFGHHLRAEKVFQTENMTENRTWKRKDLIFKPGSEFLLLQKHQEQDLSLALHCHIHLCTSHYAFFLWCEPEEELIQAFEKQAVRYQNHRVAGLFIQLLMEVMD